LPDEDTPIRVPTLRGHLRFWWRAFFAYKYPTVAALKEAENRYWGCTENSSSIRLFVHSYRAPTPATIPASRPTDRFPIPEEPRYALFPAQQDHKNIGKLSPRGASFKLEVATSNEDAKVQAQLALFALANFGGYGARSRRGCGTFYSENFVPDLSKASVNDVLTYLRKPFLPMGKVAPATDWPSLKGSVIVLGPRAMPVQEAWQAVIGLYRDFRQDRPNRGGGRPGRNRWPEPDSVRLDRDTHSPNHSPIQMTGDYPRAIFGLPIIFHFKDVRDGDPADQTLEPSTEDQGGRLASPFILKPLMVSPTHAFPMVMRLHSNVLDRATEMGRQLENLRLRQKQEEDLTVSAGPRRADEEFLGRVVSEWKTPRLIL